MMNFSHAFRKHRGTPQNIRFHYMPTQEEMEKELTCDVCSREIRSSGRSYYCPKCRRFYCPDCVVESIGGATCPHCSEISYLQIVTYS